MLKFRAKLIYFDVLPMVSTLSPHLKYRLSVAYRLVLSFGLGYCSAQWLNVIIAVFAHQAGLARAESVVLAMLMSLIYACGFVLSGFIISSLVRLSCVMIGLSVVFYSIYRSIL